MKFLQEQADGNYKRKDVLMKTKLLILFGGASSEHEVSCKSAASVLRNLNEEKYEIYKVGITKEGNWFMTDSEPDDIESGAWKENKNNFRAALSPDPTVGGLTVLHYDGTYETIKVDVCYPVLHGKHGEDGTMQGLLELAQIPFVGPGCTASAASMDKGITKLMILPTGVDQADFYITDRFTFASNPEGIIEEIEDHFNKQYPLFVKPANAGSSVGISKAHDMKELFNAIRVAAVEDNKILIEETIVGREIEVAVLGNLHPKASKVGEILAANEFYDYEAKYNNAASVTRIIDDLPEEKLDEIREDALTVYKTMGCKGLSRVDFFLTEDGRVVFNELNTLPGFTNISMYPKLWEATELPYEELLDTLIDLAMDKME